MYRWVWQLVSPVHIGWAPAGALNRTRLYIPARNLWGALTAELSRRQSSNRTPSSNFPNYEKTGKNLRQNTRFSYLFPAEQVDGEWKAWLPQYQEGKGLVWKREDGNGELEERRFRLRLLSTRPGTAIEPATNSAAEGTLREFELISTWWRPRDEGHDPQPVGMVGYLFCKDISLYNSIKRIDELFIGGDTRYGLGRMRRVPLENADNLFGFTVDLSGDSPTVHTKWVLAHALSQSPDLLGSQECICGWDMLSGRMKPPRLVWAPGCFIADVHDFVIGEDGLWEKK